MKTASLPQQHSHPLNQFTSTKGCILAWILCGFALLGGCEHPQSAGAETSSNAPTTENQAVEAAIPFEGPIEVPSEEATTAITPKQPLDLSRDALDQLEETGSDLGNQTADRDNLLPDLFEDGAEQTGARTSGRVLMRDDAETLSESVDGLEFKVEVPVN